MKISLRELKEIQNSLAKVISFDMEFKLAYRLRKFANKIIRELKDFEEIRLERVKKYGEQDEQGIIKVKSENIEVFDKEMNEVLDEEIELDMQLIPYDLLEKSNIKLSPVDIVLLERFIEEGKE